MRRWGWTGAGLLGVVVAAGLALRTCRQSAPPPLPWHLATAPPARRMPTVLFDPAADMDHDHLDDEDDDTPVFDEQARRLGRALEANPALEAFSETDIGLEVRRARRPFACTISHRRGAFGVTATARRFDGSMLCFLGDSSMSLDKTLGPSAWLEVADILRDEGRCHESAIAAHHGLSELQIFCRPDEQEPDPWAGMTRLADQTYQASTPGCGGPLDGTRRTLAAELLVCAAGNASLPGKVLVSR